MIAKADLNNFNEILNIFIENKRWFNHLFNPSFKSAEYKETLKLNNLKPIEKYLIDNIKSGNVYFQNGIIIIFSVPSKGIYKGNIILNQIVKSKSNQQTPAINVLNMFIEKYKGNLIVADVRIENLLSNALFKKAGFTLQKIKNSKSNKTSYNVWMKYPVSKFF